MAEPIDVFVDTVHINVLPLGCTLQFGLTKPAPMVLTQPGVQPPPLTSDRVATIRLTTELLKGMAFLLREHVLQYEKTSGFKVQLPPDLMANALVGTTRERWDRCWE